MTNQKREWEGAAQAAPIQTDAIEGYFPKITVLEKCDAAAM